MRVLKSDAPHLRALSAVSATILSRSIREGGFCLFFAINRELNRDLFCLNTDGELNPHTVLRICAAWPKLTGNLFVSIRGVCG